MQKLALLDVIEETIELKPESYYASSIKECLKVL